MKLFFLIDFKANQLKKNYKSQCKINYLIKILFKYVRSLLSHNYSINIKISIKRQRVQVILTWSNPIRNTSPILHLPLLNVPLEPYIKTLQCPPFIFLMRPPFPYNSFSLLTLSLVPDAPLPLTLFFLSHPIPHSPQIFLCLCTIS